MRLLKFLTPGHKPLPLILGFVLGASCVLAQTPPPAAAFQYNGSAWAALTVTSANLADTLSYTPPPAALYCQYTSTATAFSITSNVVTVTATNTFVVGQQPLLFGFTTATYLNNFVVTIVSASGSQYTFNFTHANVGSTGDTGTANLWVPATTACFGGSSATATNLAGGSIGTIPYQSAAGTTAMLAANVAATDQVLVSHGTGAAGLAPTLSNAPALAITNMSGTGTNFTLVNPALGTPASGVLTNTTGLPVATGISGLGTGIATALAATPQGSGSIVLATSPTLTTPTIGAALGSSLVLGTVLTITNGAANAIDLGNTSIMNWSSGACCAAKDTTLSRIGVGLLGIGLTGGTASSDGSLKVQKIFSNTNCANGASPSVCASASAGAVAIPTGVNPTLVVNTTAVTSTSQITLVPDDSVTIGATTCNSTLATLVGGMAVTARTAGTSFTISFNGTITTNPLCVSYTITN